jgi:hypothetical protein
MVKDIAGASRTWIIGTGGSKHVGGSLTQGGVLRQPGRFRQERSYIPDHCRRIIVHGSFGLLSCVRVGHLLRQVGYRGVEVNGCGLTEHYGGEGPVSLREVQHESVPRQLAEDQRAIVKTDAKT